jgi:hypothetical protein
MFLLPLAWFFSWSGSFLLFVWLLCIALWFFLLLVRFFHCLELTNLIAFLIVLVADFVVSFFVVFYTLILPYLSLLLVWFFQCFFCWCYGWFKPTRFITSCFFYFVFFLILQFLLYCVYVVIVLFLAYVFFSPLRLISFSLCYVNFVLVGLQILLLVVLRGWLGGVVELAFFSRLFSACIILFSMVTRECNKTKNSSCFVLVWEAEGKWWRERRGEKISAA